MSRLSVILSMRKLFFIIAWLAFFPSCVSTPSPPPAIKEKDQTEENEKYIVIFRANGRLAIFFKKTSGKELTAAEKAAIDKELEEMSPRDKKILEYFLNLRQDSVPLIIPKRLYPS